LETFEKTNKNGSMKSATTPIKTKGARSISWPEPTRKPLAQ